MDKDTTTLNEQIKELDIDNFFLLFYIVATIIGINRNFIVRESLINDFKLNKDMLKKMDVSVPAILLIARWHFLKNSIKLYFSNPTRYNLNYLVVAILVFFSSIIDLYTNIIEPQGEGSTFQF